MCSRVYREQSPTLNTGHDHLARWQLYLTTSSWKPAEPLYMEWLLRGEDCTLITPLHDPLPIEDVSGINRSDEETFTAYSLSASDGVKEILRLAVQDGMSAREAWHYLLLWQGFTLEWPWHEYHDEHGLVPMELVMIMQGLERGWGGWRMTRECRIKCGEYLAKRTIYSPFPTEFLSAGINAHSLWDLLASRFVFLGEEWNSFVVLNGMNCYSTARIFNLATNFALACVKVETVAVKPPFDESEHTKRKEIFERLEVQELLFEELLFEPGLFIDPNSGSLTTLLGVEATLS